MIFGHCRCNFTRNVSYHENAVKRLIINQTFQNTVLSLPRNIIAMQAITFLHSSKIRRSKIVRLRIAYSIIVQCTFFMSTLIGTFWLTSMSNWAIHITSNSLKLEHDFMKMNHKTRIFMTNSISRNTKTESWEILTVRT